MPLIQVVEEIEDALGDIFAAFTMQLQQRSDGRAQQLITEAVEEIRRACDRLEAMWQAQVIDAGL